MQPEEAGNFHYDPTSAATSPVRFCERERTAVSFRDLSTQHQANSRASWLGGEKWDEQIGGVRKSWAVVNDRKLHSRPLERPLDQNFSADFEHSFGGIADQIDQ